MGDYTLVVRNRLYDVAGRPWEGDNTSLKAELANASTYWSDIASPEMKGAKFPVKYSEAEVSKCLDIDTKQKAADAQMQRLRDLFVVNIDGWVPSELYDEAREREQAIKQVMLESTEMDDERDDLNENWPFQDHEEID